MGAWEREQVADIFLGCARKDWRRVALAPFILLVAIVGSRRVFEESSSPQHELASEDGGTIRSRRLLSDLREWDASTTKSEDRLAAAELVDAGLPDFDLRESKPLEWFECGGVKHEMAIFVHKRTGLEFCLIEDQFSGADSRERRVRT